MTGRSDAKADKAMQEIWSEWLAFYNAHFRGTNIAISAADQMAFYEIAQPKLRALARANKTESRKP